MKTSWIRARQTRYTFFVTTYVLVVLAVLALVNWLANRHNKSVDMTANKRYSLSDQTHKIVNDLKQDVRIAYYDKTDNFATARDLLSRYDSLSPKVVVDYIDPDKKPQMARAAGVRTYGTTLVSLGSRREEAKSLTEEEVTGAMVRALKGADKTVCAVTGSGEHSFEETAPTGYSGLKESLERNNYKTRSISLLEKPEVPKDCTIVIIGGPKFDYVEAAVKAIAAYVDAGGAVLVMLDAPVRSAKETVADNAALLALVQQWGVTANKDLVVDASGIGQAFGLSEVVPLVTRYESHAVVRAMRGIATAFPFARSLEVSGTAAKLFSTTENSLATTQLNLTEDLTIDPAKSKKGPFLLAAAGTREAGGGEKKVTGRFVVIGSSGFVANNILAFNGNQDLALNMLNWLSADEELISVRPKDPEDRRLTMTGAQARLMLYTSVILIPLAVALAGVSVWWKRR